MFMTFPIRKNIVSQVVYTFSFKKHSVSLRIFSLVKVLVTNHVSHCGKKTAIYPYPMGLKTVGKCKSSPEPMF